jgi:hypothetical protein
MLKSIGAQIGGAGGGAGPLDSNGQIPASQIPEPIAILAAYKPSITNRSNTTVLADDPNLIFTNVPAGTYALEALIGADAGSSTPDISVGFRVSTGTTSICYVLGLAGQQATTLNITQVHIPDDTPTGLAYELTSANDTAIHFSGLLTIPSVADVALQWAQNVADAQSTNVFRGSWMTLRRLGA